MGKLQQLKGLVLTGGQSTRMGKDKALICYYRKPQYLHIAQLISPYCSEVYISAEAKRAENYINLSYKVLIDKYKNCGPMGGLLTAFDFDPNSAWLVLACDYPMITRNELDLLLEKRNTSKLATAFLNEETKAAEPLITIWERVAQPLVLDSHKRANYSLRQLLMSYPVELVSSPDQQRLLNVNTETEMEAVCSIIAEASSKSQKA